MALRALKPGEAEIGMTVNTPDRAPCISGRIVSVSACGRYVKVRKRYGLGKTSLRHYSIDALEAWTDV